MAKQWFELLMTDHETTEKVFDAMAQALQDPQGPPPDMVLAMLEYCTAYVDNCHNKKEEDHLFPLIERRGIPRTGGPLAVMLAEHEQSRAHARAPRAGGPGLRGWRPRRAGLVPPDVPGVRRAAEEPLLEGERHSVPDGAARDERGRRPGDPRRHRGDRGGARRRHAGEVLRDG